MAKFCAISAKFSCDRRSIRRRGSDKESEKEKADYREGIRRREGGEKRQSSPERYSPGRGRNERVGRRAEFLEERANERARSELELARLSLERSQGH